MKRFIAQAPAVLGSTKDGTGHDIAAMPPCGALGVCGGCSDGIAARGAAGGPGGGGGLSVPDRDSQGETAEG